LKETLGKELQLSHQNPDIETVFISSCICTHATEIQQRHKFWSCPLNMCRLVVSWVRLRRCIELQVVDNVHQTGKGVEEVCVVFQGSVPPSLCLLLTNFLEQYTSW